ncbi:hypothetical protein [Salidesulfovibrio brasiliensis]|uniref:hypothetical protein n=1 Tax=Salidesulfovibrio brasiliensis TaxID=221711 RepID=UPI0006D1A0B9|nr:hypothetical protein [Salidesulfovibrio brasiliensis]
MASKKNLYTVHAFRWGDPERHSYIVGVYPKKQAALTAAETEEEYRGGKYICEVREWLPGEGIEGTHCKEAKIIKPLPEIDRLTQAGINFAKQNN